MASGAVDGVQIPSTFTNLGNFANNQLLEGHIFNQGLEMPDVLKTLIIKFPEFFLLSLLDKIGVSDELDNNTRAWNIMGNTRSSATVSSVANGTTATATLTLDTAYDAATGNLGYYLVGDTIRVAQSGEIGRVTAVGNSGGTVQTIDVVRAVGGNWSTALINTNFTIGHIGTSFGEGSAASGGYRSYFPTQDYNVTTVLRRGFKVSRDAMISKKWVDAPGGRNWWYSQEDFEQRNFMRDIELTTIFGKRFKSTALQGPNLSRGLMEYAETSGVQETFSSAAGVQEANWSNLLTQLSDQQGGNDLVALCGTQILADTQHALADRYRTIPHSEKPVQLAGLNFTSYEILGKRVHFAKYELFSDTAALPTVSASGTTKDFRNLALILDFSQTENGSNIQMHYRKGAKMIQNLYPGMPGPGAITTYDGVQGELLSEFMPLCFLPNRLGLCYANS